MADRTFQPSLTLGGAVRTLDITFFPNGASNPTTNAWQTRGVSSITRTGTGTYLITLLDQYLQIKGAFADLAKATATANWAQVGTISNVGTSTPVTIVVRTVDNSGSPVDEAAAATTYVCVSVTFNDNAAW